MATIEERAVEWIKSKDTSAMILENGGVSGAAVEIYKQAATEQDRISRAEERERCIKSAQDFICAGCIGENKIDRCQTREVCTKRGRMFRIRKAMEWGEV